MQALVLLQQRCMYVHPSVCPSHFGIMVVYKNNKKRHDFFTDGEPIRSLVLAHSLSGSSRNSKGVTPSEGVKWKFACSYLRMCYFRPLRHRISDRCKIGQVFIDPCYELQKVPRNPTFHKKSWNLYREGHSIRTKLAKKLRTLCTCDRSAGLLTILFESIADSDTNTFWTILFIAYTYTYSDSIQTN